MTEQKYTGKTLQPQGTTVREDAKTAWRWVEQSANGDTKAFGRLYESHYQEVYRYIRRRTATTELAEDLTQDTFVRAMRATHRVADRGVPVAAWLQTIARNLV